MIMKMLVTAARIRSVLDGARTEKDAADALRRHRIKYTYSTVGGVLHIRIPSRSGVVTVTRTASRSAPLRIAAGYPAPVPCWTWDD